MKYLVPDLLHARVLAMLCLNVRDSVRHCHIPAYAWRSPQEFPEVHGKYRVIKGLRRARILIGSQMGVHIIISANLH